VSTVGGGGGGEGITVLRNNTAGNPFMLRTESGLNGSGAGSNGLGGRSGETVLNYPMLHQGGDLSITVGGGGSKGANAVAILQTAFNTTYTYSIPATSGGNSVISNSTMTITARGGLSNGRSGIGVTTANGVSPTFSGQGAALSPLLPFNNGINDYPELGIYRSVLPVRRMSSYTQSSTTYNTTASVYAGSTAITVAVSDIPRFWGGVSVFSGAPLTNTTYTAFGNEQVLSTGTSQTVPPNRNNINFLVGAIQQDGSITFGNGGDSGIAYWYAGTGNSYANNLELIEPTDGQQGCVDIGYVGD
jgi:hypothetical protein